MQFEAFLQLSVQQAIATASNEGDTIRLDTAKHSTG